MSSFIATPNPLVLKRREAASKDEAVGFGAARKPPRRGLSFFA